MGTKKETTPITIHPIVLTTPEEQALAHAQLTTLHNFLSGAEEEVEGVVEGEGAGDEEEIEEGEEEELEEEEEEADLPASALRNLRKKNRENKNLRNKAKELEDRLKEYEQRDMNELEKAQAARDEALQRAEQLERENQEVRFRSSVISAASNFSNPEDAIAFIDRDEIVFKEDGTPDTKSLKAALKRLSDDKPYLLSTRNVGSGDGGERGGSGSNDDVEKRTRTNLASRGAVPIP